MRFEFGELSFNIIKRQESDYMSASMTLAYVSRADPLVHQCQSTGSFDLLPADTV